VKAGPAQQGQDKSFKVMEGDFKTSSSTLRCKLYVCVEVAIKPEGVAVRDSKNRANGTLFFTHSEWNAFLDGAKKGEFDI